MKRTKLVGLIILFFAAGTVVSVGCNQAEPMADKNHDSTVSVETGDGDECQTGCCGKCDAEQSPAETTDGCCGKCAGETMTKSPAQKPEEGCQNECNACANGDTENCKCGNEPVEKQNDKKTAESASRVNTMPQDRDIFHILLQNHDKITRTVTEIEGGVKTITESTDSAITRKIQEHVASMYKRVEDGRPLRMWDELYREIFKHADKIKMEVKKTKNGISVTETAKDPYVVKLIRSHAKVVTGFTKKGFEEARLNHEPPKVPQVEADTKLNK